MLAFPLSFVEYFQPRILDDYSDPVDVKNKILDSKKAKEKLLAITEKKGSEYQESDDDYSVPYEVRKNIQGKSCNLAKFTHH